MSYKELNNRESSESQFFKEETTYGSSGLEEYQTSKSSQGWRWIPFILSALLNLALAYPLIIGKRESGCETDFGMHDILSGLGIYSHLGSWPFL
jgi:hypothetical protein